jgi:hypothetical protein
MDSVSEWVSVILIYNSKRAFLNLHPQNPHPQLPQPEGERLRRAEGTVDGGKTG